MSYGDEVLFMRSADSRSFIVLARLSLEDDHGGGESGSTAGMAVQHDNSSYFDVECPKYRHADASRHLLCISRGMKCSDDILSL